MVCQSAQNRILMLPDPRQVPDAVRAHLDECPACLAWWQRAARLERLLEQLPAPPAPADKKAVLLDQLTAAGPVIKCVPSEHRGDVPSPGTAFLKRVGKYAAALAAAVLVAVVGWRLIPKGGQDTVKTPPAGPRHPLLDSVVKRDVALAKADTPGKRLEVLGGLADDLSAEARGLARVAKPDELDDLAKWYGTVVGDGIVRQTAALEKLPVHPIARAEKAAVYGKLAGQLGTAARDAEALKKEAPPGAHKALDEIAKAAADGRDRLVKLADTTAAAAPTRGPGSLAADEQIRLFRANRVLVGKLVERGVEMSGTDDPAVRVDACQKAAADLVTWGVEPAAAADDPHRVAEFGDLLEAVVRDGLLPSLEAGRALYPPESQHGKVLLGYRKAAADNLVRLSAAVEGKPAVSTDAQVKALRDRLDALKMRLQ